MPSLFPLRLVRAFMPDGDNNNDWRPAVLLRVNNAETNEFQMTYYVSGLGWNDVGAVYDAASDPPVAWTWREVE